MELRNVSCELRNVSCELRNVSLELRNVSLELRNVSLEGVRCGYLVGGPEGGAGVLGDGLFELHAAPVCVHPPNMASDISQTTFLGAANPL